MRIDEAILDRVRDADPIDRREIAEWIASPAAAMVLHRITETDPAVADVGVGVETSRRHRTRRVTIAATLVTVGIGSVAAASGAFGDPAPANVRADLAAVDDGMPADLRLDPDVDNARVAATTASATLYAADLADGGYCFEIALNPSRTRGAICVPTAEVGARPIEVSAPLPSGLNSALVAGGRINDVRVTALVVRYPDGTTAPIATGAERYWMLEVPDGERVDAATGGITIVGLDAAGDEVASQVVPPLGDEDPTGTALDGIQPIFVSTISTGDDLTKVLGVEGSVNAPGAVSLELRYPDGSTDTVPLAADGSFRYILAAAHQDDFADAAGRLVALDVDGAVVATAPVSSVANARRGS